MSAAPSADAPPRVRLLGLEGLRAFAALAIVVYHAGRWSQAGDGWTAAFLRNLDLGVPVFFVVSGFVLYRPFAECIYADDPLPAARAFLRRRVFRIYPAYWIAYAATVVWVLPSVPPFHSLLANLSLTELYFPSTLSGAMDLSWTLVIEMSFYLFLPVFAIALHALGKRIGFWQSQLGALGLLVVGGTALQMNSWRGFPIEYLAFKHPQVWDVLPPWLGLFGAGMSLAVLSVVVGAAPTPPRWFRAIVRLDWLCLVLAATTYLALTTAVWFASRTPFLGSTNIAWVRVFSSLAIGTLLVLAASNASQPGRRWGAAFTNTPIVALGTISYGIYLWHNLILYKLASGWFTEPGTTSLVLLVSVGLALTIPIALASYRFVEEPMMRRSRRSARQAAARD
jgi:peptidoglycan/LPS O-acetylase OafA/YrhL